MAKTKPHYALIFFLLISLAGNAQYSFLEKADSIHRLRFNTVVYGGGALAVGSLAGLYQAWYAQYPQSGFHFHDDADNWLQMDKLGHMGSAYWIGEYSYELLRWSGVGENHAIWYGGLTGFTYLAVVEIMDGFSDGWGFSVSDFVANGMGSALFISQQKIWGEQRIRMKFSYSRTHFPQYNSSLLGQGLSQEWLKDYNGQTYWFTVMPRQFGAAFFPEWLGVSLGYSGTGMIGAVNNPAEFSHYSRNRQYMLSLDLDLSRIPVRAKWLKTVFKTVNFIKIPAPALKFENGRFTGHGVYF